MGRRVGVLVSGEGSNLQALLDAGLSGRCGRVEPYAARGVSPELLRPVCPARRSRSTTTPTVRRATSRMAGWLEGHGVTLVVCAGYMHLLRPCFPRAVSRAVVNVHPALLPAFPGAHAVEDVLAAGSAETGATVHSSTRVSTPGLCCARSGCRCSWATRAESLHARIRDGRAPAAARGREGAGRAMSVRRALLSDVRQDRAGRVRRRAAAARRSSCSRAAARRASSRDAGLEVTPLEELTGFAEMLGHRVVTLHPAVHGGILARRDMPEDLADLDGTGIEPIDLVCVNLYPFEETVGGLDVSWEEAIEKIDVGGPAHAARRREESRARGPALPARGLRAGARGAAELRATSPRRPGARSRSTRSRRRPRTTAPSPAGSAATTGCPRMFTPVFDRERELSYGENPHQRAAYYAERGSRTHLLSRVEQLHGKALSYNNLNDLSAARLLALELEGPLPA